jgi:hypothetical protein
LAGYGYNRRVMVTKAITAPVRRRTSNFGARLELVVRVNLDSHISRIDLIGKTRSNYATVFR